MDFTQDFPINSAAIFQQRENTPLDIKAITRHPKIGKYQEYFERSKGMADVICSMTPKPLDQTLKFLNDREKIQVELQGVQERVMEQVLKKDNIQKETDICNQHAANADANKDSEYEAEEQKMEKVQLAVGTYVTNCLDCNRTCHYPCVIPNDSSKHGYAAMHGDSCTVCPKKCHWTKHVNNEYRIVYKVQKIKKTYMRS